MSVYVQCARPAHRPLRLRLEVDGQAQGLTGKVPLSPDRFQGVVDGAKFSHGDNDLPFVNKIQKNMVVKREHLVLKRLPAKETFG